MVSNPHLLSVFLNKGENSNFAYQPNFSIDESDNYGYKKNYSIRISSIKKINKRNLFTEYKNNRAPLVKGMNKNLVYMHFIWELASTLILHFEKQNKRIIENYWGDSKWQKIIFIDNKAEIAKSKMLLGKNYDDLLKDSYFSILKSVYKIKITIEPFIHSIRGIRFIDFIKEDFDLFQYEKFGSRHRLLRLFRDLLKKCEYLSYHIFQSIDKPLMHGNRNNEQEKNKIRHSGKQNLKDDIITYIFNLDTTKINKSQKNNKNTKDSEFFNKYSSLAIFCEQQHDHLLRIFRNYKSDVITKKSTFADIALYEKPNYLNEKEDNSPDFERIFRKWIKEKDQIFIEAINRVVEIKQTNK